jgi:hypothetical protein
MMQALGAGIPPPQNQQLPAQMFTTAAQLLDLTDSKIPPSPLLAVSVGVGECCHSQVAKRTPAGNESGKAA